MNEIRLTSYGMLCVVLSTEDACCVVYVLLRARQFYLIFYASDVFLFWLLPCHVNDGANAID